MDNWYSGQNGANFLQEKEDENILKNLMLSSLGQKNISQLNITSHSFKLRGSVVCNNVQVIFFFPKWFNMIFYYCYQQVSGREGYSRNFQRFSRKVYETGSNFIPNTCTGTLFQMNASCWSPIRLDSGMGMNHCHILYWNFPPEKQSIRELNLSLRIASHIWCYWFGFTHQML